MKEDKAENSEKKDDVIEISFRNYLAPVRKNPWILISIVLIIALIGVLIMYYNGDGAGVGEKKAASSLINFTDSQGGGNATLVSSSTNGSLYQVVVNYQGEDIPVYVTRDGNYLITTLIPLIDVGNARDLPAQTAPVEIPIGDSDASIGNVSAPVTVVEFSDFSCPYCAAASGDNAELVAYMKQNSPNWEPAVSNIMKDYVNTGKVRFVAKYAMGHSGGHPAQSVAWCLNEQGLYWKFYPKAYADQDNVEDLAKMTALAKTVGADMTKSQSCLDSKKYDSRFDLEQNQARAAGVSGTPAFFVNGKLYSGAQPYSVFKAAIDAELTA